MLIKRVEDELMQTQEVSPCLTLSHSLLSLEDRIEGTLVK